MSSGCAWNSPDRAVVALRDFSRATFDDRTPFWAMIPRGVIGSRLRLEASRMIVRFSVANWMSFRDRVTLSMVASLERQHGDRVARIGRYPLRVLPVMALYGGNASGKTNLFKALSFARTQIVEGSRPDARIPVIPFLLDKDRAQQPTHFEFDLLIDEVVYAFSFSVTRGEGDRGTPGQSQQHQRADTLRPPGPENRIRRFPGGGTASVSQIRLSRYPRQSALSDQLNIAERRPNRVTSPSSKITR